LYFVVKVSGEPLLSSRVLQLMGVYNTLCLYLVEGQLSDSLLSKYAADTDCNPEMQITLRRVLLFLPTICRILIYQGHKYPQNLCPKLFSVQSVFNCQ